MRWRQIDKLNVVAPTTGDYRSWKPRLAKEAELQCVYCCIHENRFGGIRNFHVEHYRPKSRWPNLTNDYANLFYACGICNIFKSDDWPCDLDHGDLTQAGYPDPSAVNYGDFLHIDEATGTVYSDTVTGRYVIERLHLNRGQMVGLRSMSFLLERIARVEDILKSVNFELVSDSVTREAIDVLLRINTMLRRFGEARPYGHDQLR